MAREQLTVLTEQMFYILLVLKDEMYGLEIANSVKELTAGRITLAPGTLYALLGRFENDGYIDRVYRDSNRKVYKISEKGEKLLDDEVLRLEKMLVDYESRRS